MVAGLAGQYGKQVTKPLAGGLEKPPVTGDAHDRLSDRERDDLGVGELTASVPAGLWQEIVSRAINSDAEGVEVGVHRGLLVDGVLDTADFGPSAPKPSRTTKPVESII